MKRKILVAIYTILILLTIKLLYNTTVNSILVEKYNKGQYSENSAKLLGYANFLQGYVANYNYGNILYQNGKYEEAIKKYKKALKGIIPKNKECNIRINYALAICKTVQVNESNQQSITEAIKKYESAIDVLTKKGCANKENNNGHNPKAEQLKKDIQKEIDRLKELQKDEQKENEKNEEEEQENKDNKSEEATNEIEEKIQDIKEEATKEQRERETKYDYYNKDYKYTGRNKNW